MVGDKKLLIFIFLFFSIGLVSAAHSSELNNLLLKVSVKSGDLVNKSVSLTASEPGQFSLDIANLNNVKINEQSFVLAKGEQKQFIVSFDARKLNPGVYTGSIKINDGNEVSLIPIIFEVESADIFFDSNLDIPPQYSTISAGDKLLAQLKIYDLTSGGTSDGLGSTKIDVDHFVYGIDGGVLSSESETIVINKQTQITKSLSFPEDVKKGDYVFVAVVKYKSSVGVSSSMFSIVPANSKGLFSGASDLAVNNFLLIIIIFILIIVLFFFFFIYLNRQKDKFISELRKCNSLEMQRQRKFLLEQQKILLRKQGVNHGAVKREINHKIANLKRKHKQREVEMKKLSGEGKVEEMQRRLKEWKSLGYNTSGLDYALKGVSVKDMKDLLHKWKSEYR